MHTKFSKKRKEESDHFEDMGVDGRI